MSSTTEHTISTLIHKSISEALDFGSIEIETTPISDIKNQILCAYNTQIPIDVLLASVYKVKSIKAQKTPIDIDGFPAWVSLNYESFPAKYDRHIKNFTKPPLKEIDSGCPFHDNSHIVIAGLPAKYRVELHNQGFIRVSSTYAYKNYVKNFKIDPSDIKSELDDCINAIIEHAIGKPYNYRDHLFQKMEDRTDDKVFYSLWISPDNGLIIVDHISMYDKPPKHNMYASYDV